MHSHVEMLLLQLCLQGLPIQTEATGFQILDAHLGVQGSWTLCNRECLCSVWLI